MRVLFFHRTRLWKRHAPAVASYDDPHRKTRSNRSRLAALWIALIATTAFVEVHTSVFEATLLTVASRQAVSALAPGQARAPLTPRGGPYDRRLGYSNLTTYTQRLTERGFTIVAQASPSPTLRFLNGLGVAPPYREKSRTGLRIVDAGGEAVFASPKPELAFASFDEVPPLIVNTLLFIENRDLLEPSPNHNPAIEWPRLARATVEWGTSAWGDGGHVAGASTLATQLEKLRHSPHGLTGSGIEKLRQMASASLRAYHDGPDTRATRRRIIVDYLNSIQLAAVPGHGEVIGLPLGLALWYGSDYQAVGALMNSEVDDELSQRARAYAYRQSLSLILAAGRPSLFLVTDHNALAARTDRFLHALADAGVIDINLRDAALVARPEFHLRRYHSQTPTPEQRSDSRPIRTHLLDLLGVDGLYELDQLDLEVRTTTRAMLEREVQRALDDFTTPDGPMVAWLRRAGVLNAADPSALTLSFSLYERTANVNRLRLHADTRRSYQIVDDSVMLDLGSTAKLRTLATYLELMVRLYNPPHPDRELDPRDRLAQWARERRRTSPGESIDEFLEAALERRYSASPHERFYTGRGFHRFENFDSDHDDSRFSVRNATRYSNNLVFIRLFRDIVDHLAFGIADKRAGILTNPDHPLRAVYLMRAARTEGSQLLTRYYARYAGRDVAAMRANLFSRIGVTPRRLAVVTRLMQPEMDVTEFRQEMRKYDDGSERWQLDDEALTEMYADYDSSQFAPHELAHLAGTDWLQLWTLARLAETPEMSLDALQTAGSDQMETAFAWLLNTTRGRAQERRIFAELEVDAFDWIHKHWQSHGYPFKRLVPSLATALGASADRPSALAELMGIIQADGLRLPTVRIEQLRFGANTPYDTVAMPLVAEPRRVMSAQVARVLRKLLVSVAEHGTARRTGATIRGPNGLVLSVGGKTGTGDHVRKTVDRDGVVTSTSAVSRSATLAFLIGDRYYGVVTGYVKGPESKDYDFTSALATEIFRSLRLVIMTLIDEHSLVDAAALPTRF